MSLNKSDSFPSCLSMVYDTEISLSKLTSNTPLLHFHPGSRCSEGLKLESHTKSIHL